MEQEKFLPRKHITFVVLAIYAGTSILAYCVGAAGSSQKDSEISYLQEKLETLSKENDQAAALCALNARLDTAFISDCDFVKKNLKESSEVSASYPDDVAQAATALKSALSKTPIITKMAEMANQEKSENFSKLVIWKDIPSGDSVSSDIRGTDFKALYDLLDAAVRFAGKKKEFETQADYIGRVEKKVREAGLSEAVDGHVIFYAPLRWRYDAEKKHFTGSSPSYSVTLWNPDTEQNGGYVGENAFGVKKEITKEDSQSGSISFSVSSRLYDTPDFKYTEEHKFACELTYSYDKKDDIFIPIETSEEAEALSKELYGLYVVKLHYPWKDFDYEHTKPTLSDPVEKSHSSYSIITDPREFWIVDNRSGKVLKKIKAQKCVEKKAY